MRLSKLSISIFAALGFLLVLSSQAAAQTIAISDNEKYFATGIGETIGIWDMARGAKITTAEGWAAAFSADGETFATSIGSSDASMTKVWKPGKSDPIGTFAGGFVALSHDGKWLVTNHAQDGVRLWDAGSGAVVRTLVAGPIELSTLAVSPDFSWLALHRPGAVDVEIINVGDAKIAHSVSLEKHPELGDSNGFTDGIAISSNGKLLAYTYGTQWDFHRILVADATTGKQVVNFKATMGSSPEVQFDPSGTMVISSGNTVDLWSATTGKLIRTFNIAPLLYHIAEYGTSSVASRDGKLLVVSGPESRTMLFNLATGREVRWFRTLKPKSYQFTPAGNLPMIMDANGIVTLRNAATGKLIRQVAKTGINE
jgi:WD40 repeat protein